MAEVEGCSCVLSARTNYLNRAVGVHCRVYVWLRDAIACAGSDLYLGLSLVMYAPHSVIPLADI